MKKISLISLLTLVLFSLGSCDKDSIGNESFDNISTPRTQIVPDELVGRWAIIGISGSTVYNIPAGSTYNTNEVFLGYQINKDGSTKEDGYISTYQYGVSTWAKWSAVGSIELSGDGISFHRARGSYTSSRNSSVTQYGAAEVYPNKSAHYVSYRLATDGRGQRALFVTNADGSVTTYVKQ